MRLNGGLMSIRANSKSRYVIAPRYGNYRVADARPQKSAVTYIDNWHGWHEWHRLQREQPVECQRVGENYPNTKVGSLAIASGNARAFT